jgi:hypothetical protein
MTPTLESSDVSLYSITNSLVMVGITQRTACGITMRDITWDQVMPSE